MPAVASTPTNITLAGSLRSLMIPTARLTQTSRNPASTANAKPPRYQRLADSHAPSSTVAQQTASTRPMTTKSPPDQFIPQRGNKVMPTQGKDRSSAAVPHITMRQPISDHLPALPTFLVIVLPLCVSGRAILAEPREAGMDSV